MLALETPRCEVEDVPALTPRVRTIEELDGPWRVAHVKSRQEKILALSLIGLGVDYFLPIYERLTVSGRLRRVFRLPLFPGYLCFSGDVDVAATVYGTGRVCRIIEVKDQPRFARDIQSLAHALDANPRIDPCPDLVTGRKCRVTSGPFQGIYGVVLGRGVGQRIVVEIEGMGRASLEIPAESVEPA